MIVCHKTIINTFKKVQRGDMEELKTLPKNDRGGQNGGCLSQLQKINCLVVILFL